MSAHLRRRRWLRAFNRPGLWCSLGLLAVVAVVTLSLLPAGAMPSSGFTGGDKVGHFIAYAALSGYASMLLERKRARALAAIALIGLGIGLEIAQGSLTATRTAEIADALANGLGVLAGLAVGATRLAHWLQRLDARLP